MTSLLQVPTRIAIGSNLAIVFLSSLAAFLGKALTGQIVWPLALPIILTVIPAAHLGGLISTEFRWPHCGSCSPAVSPWQLYGSAFPLRDFSCPSRQDASGSKNKGNPPPRQDTGRFLMPLQNRPGSDRSAWLHRAAYPPA